MKNLDAYISEGLLTSRNKDISAKYPVSVELIKLSMASDASEYSKISNKIVKEVLDMHPKKLNNIRIPADGTVYISWFEGRWDYPNIYPIISVYFNKTLYAFYKWKGVFQVKKYPVRTRETSGISLKDNFTSPYYVMSPEVSADIIKAFGMINAVDMSDRPREWYPG